MIEDQSAPSRFDSDLGLFVEEVTADLVRFEQAAAAGCTLDDIAVERELPLGSADCYADIYVAPSNAPPFFVEVKLRYTGREIIDRAAFKYGSAAKFRVPGNRLTLVVSREEHSNWPAVEAKLKQIVHSSLELEIWNESDLLDRLRKTFGGDIRNLTREGLRDVRRAIERTHWRFAFDGKFTDYPSAATLLWHFSPWELHRIHCEQGLEPEQILSPRVCERTVVLMCDLCSFSSFVRDTRDPRLIRRKLTEFYSLARHAVHNAGGVIYQVIGDEIVALFGLYEPPEAAARKALACAQTLFGIGRAISDAWQRAIDHVQPSRGVHIGMAVGDLNLLPLRPFSRTHIGFIGDAINMAARLRAEAKVDEVLLSNGLYRLLGDDRPASLIKLDRVEADNVGVIHAWKMTCAIA